MTSVALSQWQFAITTTYHFLFVPVTLGLSLFVALLETCYVRTKRPAWKAESLKLVKFFGGVFLINFALGVVTGIVQEFHFGMNWSEYARFMGDIFGAPLALEALTAFFLESTFLGVWIFGWGKLSKKAHCVTIWLVAIGSNLSAFWILVANSFMQHPTGFEVEGGRAVMRSFGALVSNPYVVGEMSHTFFAGVTTAGILVLSLSAYKILKGGAFTNAFIKGMKGAALYTLIGCLGVMGSGHLHAQYLHEAQPMKLSSMEALWHSENPAPFTIFAVVNQKEHRNDFEIAVPAVFSFMVYNQPSGEIQGIEELQAEAAAKYGSDNYVPNVTVLFWSFRIMIAIGGLMTLLALLSLYFARKGTLARQKCLLKVLLFALPLPFIANSVGWFIAECGRQPWIVVGLQKTAEAVSPNLTSGDVWLTLIGFTALYLVLIILALYVAVRFIRQNPAPSESVEDFQRKE